MEMNRMKKIVYSTLFFAGMFLTTACSDYLEVGSPSIVDSDFVFSNPTTARAALDGAYEQWRDCAQNKVFGDGLFYAADIAGSDIERHPESFSNQLGRHYPECLYQNGTYASSYGLTSYLKENDIYASLYAVVSKANAVITSMENAENFRRDGRHTAACGPSHGTLPWCPHCRPSWRNRCSGRAADARRRRAA